MKSDRINPMKLRFSDNVRGYEVRTEIRTVSGHIWGTPKITSSAADVTVEQGEGQQDVE